jgi:hypothetical protein
VMALICWSMEGVPALVRWHDRLAAGMT